MTGAFTFVDTSVGQRLTGMQILRCHKAQGCLADLLG
jgi:hypothetical protein